MDNKTLSHWPITLTNSVAAVFNLFLPLALVRLLSPDEVGRFKVFSLYVMLSPGLFLVSGLSNGLYHWVGKYPKSIPEVQNSWTLLIGITLFLSTVGLTVSRSFAPLIHIPLIDLKLFLFSVPFFLGSTFLEDLMIARGNIWRGSFYASGFNVLRAASAIVAAWWVRTVEGVLWVIFAGAVVRVLVGWWMLWPTGEVRLRVSWEKSMNALRYALPVSIATLAAVALQNTDQMILSIRLTREKFAFYSIGCLTIPPLMILEMSVNRILIPRLSAAFSENNLSQATALFADSVSELSLFLWPATLGLIIYSQPIIRILFTQRYLPAAAFLRPYALFYLFFAIPYDSIARARGDGGWIFRTAIIFASFSIAAIWLSASRWGAMGALWAFLTTQFLIRIYSLPYTQRYLGVSIARFMPLKMMFSETVAGLAATACSFVLHPLFSDARTWFAVTGPIFTVVYFVGVYVTRPNRNRNASESIDVLELSQTLGLGGLERMMYSLSETLHRHDRFKVLVATYDHPKDQPSLLAQFEQAEIPVIQWQKGTGFSLRTVLYLVKMCFSGRARILHVHDLGPLVYGSLAKVCSFGRVRLVLTLHTLLHLQQGPRYRFYFRFFLHFVDRIVVVSPAIKSRLVAFGVKDERIRVVPNGVRFASLPPCNPVDKLTWKKKVMPQGPARLYSVRWVLCLARLHAGKGQDVALDVWQALPSEVRAGLALFFVGPEMEMEFAKLLRQRIAGLPDSDRVIMAGPSHHPEDWIQAAHLFISGSQEEGMPLAPLEAVGSGLPALLSDISGHEFLRPWAHFFNPANAAEGAGKIAQIIADMNQTGDDIFFKTLWKTTRPVREKWNGTTMIASYIEVFQSIVGTPVWAFETALSR